VKVREVYTTGRKLRDLALLQCVVTLEYDTGVPESAVVRLKEFFGAESILVPKRTKNGMQEQDIVPMIRRMEISQRDDNTVELEALVCCQNPSLNPMQLVAAIELHCPELKADFASCRRVEIFDQQEMIFR